MPMKSKTWKTTCGTVTLILGDSFDLIPTLPAVVDAVLTDPPYSSGGMYRGDRAASTIAKYVQSDSGTRKQRTNFSGDNRDQRSFLAWCTLWLTACSNVSREGATLCCFSDWRQVPILTDAVQAGGWTWRNLCTWWKPGCRMQRGRFSSSAEFVIYATNGPHAGDGESSPQNVFSCATMSGDEKDHIAEKPAPVCDWLVSVTSPGALVLDPFMGAGTVGVACLKSGRRFIGIEKDPSHFETAKMRISAELKRYPLITETQAELFRED